jgi:DNA-binding YbaB/EbfC family protein
MADILGMMKQFGELKSKMEAMQAELDRIEVEGSSGGGLVKIKLSAKGELREINIDQSLLKAEEKAILEDLIVAAHAEARRHAEAAMQEKMQSVTGGFQLPPGLGKLF